MNFFAKFSKSLSVSSFRRSLKNRSRRCDFFCPKIVKIRAILAIFRSFEVFAGVRYLFGCFEVDPGRKKLEIYSVRDLYDRPFIKGEVHQRVRRWAGRLALRSGRHAGLRAARPPVPTTRPKP